jgi:membrane-bound serine protease (ClpP class)
MKMILWWMMALLPTVLGAVEAEKKEEAPVKEGDKRVFGKSEEASYAGRVVVIKVGEKDLTNMQSFKFMRRTLKRADAEGAKAVVFDIHTPGGYAWQTSDLMMNDLGNLQVPSFAFVNSKAMSAGALISVATDGIYMKPIAAIGAAGLVSGDGATIDDVMRAKIESAYDAFVRSVVKKKGHNLDVVRAMMFTKQEYEFGELKIGNDALLTLTSDEAVGDYDGSPLLARGIVNSIEELLEKEGMADVPVVAAEPTAFEKLAWWVKYLSPVLILVGVGAAYAEMKVPGFGVGGAISLIAFGFFFFGNYAAGNMAGYELAAVFAVGMILIALEVFVIPGTGIAGIVGIILVIGSLLLAMVDSIDFADFGNKEVSSGPGLLELVSWPAMSLALGLVGGMLLMMFMMRFLPSTPLFGFLTIKKALSSGASIDSAASSSEGRVGWTGEAITDLRPTGKADFQDETVDVTTKGDFVKKGAKVRITSEGGMGVVVHEIEGV